MKPLKLSGILVGATLLASTALAQTEKGKWELSFAGALNSGWLSQDEQNVSSDTLTVYSGAVSGGYFMTDALEIKGNIGFLGFSSGEINAYLVPLTIGLDYHFNTKGTTVPYLGVAGGAWVVGGGFKDETEAFGGVLGDAHVGIKQFLKKDVSINLEVGYQYAPLPIVSLHNVTARLGLSLMF
jgi:hypothetical protein